MKQRKRYTLVFLFWVLLIVCIAEYMFFKASFHNVSAIETACFMGVYWDKNCSKMVKSIDWGVLTPGETKEVLVYVRNEGNETCILILKPVSWNPSDASNYLSFTWSSEDKEIGAGEIINVTQSLTVSPNTMGISNFSFDIIFEGRNHLLGDINKDGVVDGKDIRIVCAAYGSTPKDSNWNPDADLNNDEVIDMKDVRIVASDYGKTL